MKSNIIFIQQYLQLRCVLKTMLKRRNPPPHRTYKEKLSHQKSIAQYIQDSILGKKRKGKEKVKVYLLRITIFHSLSLTSPLSSP